MAPRRAARAARRRARRERRADGRPGPRARSPRAAAAMRDYLASRPVVAELEAIAPRARARRRDGLRAARRARLDAARGVALVAEARARGVDVTCETCPHYLVLDEDDAERLGAVAKCAPPLRPRPSARRCGTALATATSPSSRPTTRRRRPSSSRATTCSRPGAASRRQTLLALLYDAGVARAACRSRALAELLAGAPGAPLRPRAGKGAARARRRRRPRARRPGRRWTLARERPARPPPAQPVRRARGCAARVVRTILRGRTVCARRARGRPAGRARAHPWRRPSQMTAAAPTA